MRSIDTVHGMESAPRRATATDVANLAGCSQAAVSLWLNGKVEGRLSKEWVQRIAAAANELGYVPNKAAQRLSGGQNSTVAFLFPNVQYQLFGDVLYGVARVLGERWDVHLVDMQRGTDGVSRKDIYTAAMPFGPAGVLIAAPTKSELEQLSRLPVPVVALDAPSGAEGITTISFDLGPALVDLAKHLHEQGHHRVGLVEFRGGSLILQQRSDAMRRHLDQFGIQVTDEILLVSDLSIEHVAQCVAEIFPHWREQGVTAAICTANTLAYGVLLASVRGIFQVPEELAVIGFSDSDHAAITYPPLSSISLDGRRLGEAGAEALVGLIGKGQRREAVLPTAFEARCSSLRPAPNDCPGDSCHTSHPECCRDMHTGARRRSL